METIEPVRRHWVGGAALAAALLMLVLGETVLEGRLSALGFACYWLICTVLTVVAMFAALVHLRQIRKVTRQTQQELVQETLQSLPKPPDQLNKSRKGP